MGRRVPAEVSAADIENDRGGYTPGVVADCTRCDHQTTSFGESEASVRRCLALLREECPNGEENFYVNAAEE